MTEDQREISRSELKKAIEITRTQSGLARIVGCSPQHISKSLRSGRVSAVLSLKIEKMLSGKVSKKLLSPQIDW